MIVRAKIVALAVSLIVTFGLPTARAQGTSQAATTSATFQEIDGAEKASLQKTNSLECYGYARYFVIARPTDPDGDDIIVKRKLTPEAQIPCEYKSNEADLEIKNGETDAFDFSGIVGDALFIDDGTSVNRTMHVYDIPSKKLVFDIDLYQDPVATRDGIHVSFWQSEREASKAECPKDYDELKQGQITPMIEKRKILDVRSFQVEETADWRCGEVQ